MATLADNFLKDLEDLSADEEDEIIHKEERKEEENGIEDSDDDAIPDAIDEYLKSKQTNKNSAESKLTNDLVFHQHLANLDIDLNENQQIEKFINLTRNDQIFEFIKKTNEYLRVIDGEIMNVHKFVRDKFARRFYELEQILLDPVDYVKVVKIIGNQNDVSRVRTHLNWLPNQTVMSLTVALSASTGRPLSESDYATVIRGCDEVLQLNDAKSKMLNYLSNRMHIIAPNLCEIVGSTVASKLIASAGGIVELARIPACNIQVLGSQKKALHGFSTTAASLHRGHLGELDVVKNAPQKYQIRAVRMLSTKCALAARVDACRSSTNGEIGKDLRNQILLRFDKIQAPQQPKLRKALPKPDDKPRTKRGGKKIRKMKEKYAVTQMRREANRIQFGAEQQKEYRESGHGFGMLGSSGKLRVKEEKNQRILQKRPNQARQFGGGSGATNGMASSLVMGPMQGMQLFNPLLAQKTPVQPQKDNYFKNESGFSTVISNRQHGGQTFNSNMIL